jgi:hypothetical protein
MAFCVDGYWDPVAVRVHEETGAVHGTVHGSDTLAPAVIAAALEQVEPGSSRSTSTVEVFRTSLVATQ